MAVERGWRRRFPFQHLTTAQMERLIQPFSAGARVQEAQPLSGGRRNTNYRVRLSSLEQPVVLRLYSADPSACGREAALARLLHGRVAMPEVLHAEPAADPPWAITTFVEATRFDDLLKRGSLDDVEAAARSAGRALAAIHAFKFPSPGFFGPELRVDAPLGPDTGWSGMLTDWLERGLAGLRLGPDLTPLLLRFIGENAWRMEPLRNQANLCHADYKPWNLLVKDSEIAAVLDWEFAFAGPAMNDVGIFLRHSASLPPHYCLGFVHGYTDAGGQLPEDWRRMARMIDLLSLCGFLERPEDDPAVVREVRPLIEATLREFSPGRSGPGRSGRTL